MNSSSIVENTIIIDAPIAKIWDALVNPEYTVKYMYGCIPLTDWKIGSPLLWQGQHEGQSMIFVKGTIMDFKPNKSLVYTVIDPLNPNIPDSPENYLTVTYTLRQQKGKTQFTVTQGDYNGVADGQKRYDEAVKAGGWSSILEAIKKLVEAE